MNLLAFLALTGDSAAEFSRKIGTTPQAMGRYLKHQRIPRPDVMARIVAATKGAVQPNDFYPPPSQAATPPAGCDVAASAPLGAFSGDKP